MDGSKPRTFNQLWTPEEQVCIKCVCAFCVCVPYCVLFCLKTKLEQLLEIYPPEEVESRRWEKIATALGNRTVKQVNAFVFNLNWGMIVILYIHCRA